MGRTVVFTQNAPHPTNNERDHVSESVITREDTDKEGRNEILRQLAHLGGQFVGDDDITFEGTKFVVPAAMNLRRAHKFLGQRIEADEEEHVIVRDFQYRPLDGAFNTWMTMKELFGAVIGQATYDFFGKNPPEFISIDTGFGESQQVPWGWVTIPMLDDGKMSVGSTRDREKGELFRLVYNGPRKHRYVVEGLFAAVDERLKSHSIYKGKAINGKERPEFLRTGHVNHDAVVYSEDVLDQLKANVWSVIEHTDRTRVLGLPLKRAVLLEGPYGTGKTLASAMTADKAVANGWTFLLCRPGRDGLVQTMQTAALYAPSVVFFEDVDVVAEGASTDKDSVSELLDVFDGMGAKSSEVMAVLTTNHVQKIHKGMLRPGRLDAVISINSLDAEGIQKLVTVSIPARLKDGGDWASTINWSEVTEAMDGFLPAFVKEASDRSVRYMIGRGEQDSVITTSDLVQAAEGLRPQLDLMNGAGEGKSRPTVDAAISDVVETTMETLRVWDNDDDPVGGGQGWKLVGPSAQSKVSQ